MILEKLSIRTQEIINLLFIHVVVSLDEIKIPTFPETSLNLFRLALIFVIDIDHYIDESIELVNIDNMFLVPIISIGVVLRTIDNIELLYFGEIHDPDIYYWHQIVVFE